MSANIDQITPTESLIDLSRYVGEEFVLPDHAINTLFDDIILAEFVDVSPDGNAIKRGDIWIPLNTAPRAWRVAKALVVGSGCKNINVNDLIVFPGDRGIPVSKLQYTCTETGETNIVTNGIFVNEERLFGVCSLIENESSTTDTKISS